MSTFDIFNQACRDAVSLPDGWQGNLFSAVGDPPNTQGVMVTGAVSPPYTKGARKGEPNWPKRDRKTEKTVFISREAYAAAAQKLGCLAGK